jgi:glycosyltransferase involved in cell wall biosynthesis
MSCSLPTIQTSFGGQNDYMSDKNSLYIDYSLAESEEKPAYEGINWALPNIKSIRKQMRWAFEHPQDIKQMGKQAEEDSKKFTWDCTSQKIINCLKE